MRIVQMLPSLAYGDAIGNNVFAIKDLLDEMGYATEIYAETIDGRLPKGSAKQVEQLPDLQSEDIILYHASTGSRLNYDLGKTPGRKLVIYHNITPPEFFHQYSPEAERSAVWGLDGMQYLAKYVEYCIAVSEYNKSDLINLGYSCKIDAIPILIRFEDYEKEPNEATLRRYQNDGITNILFVGRVVPNKKQEDVIRAFYCYHKAFNPNSRLILVGGEIKLYAKRLKEYAKLLGIEDCVIFTGHTKFDEILAWYRLADVFVCMSEHEGFCVPLAEAMYFDVPIIAYDCAAIPDTLGGSGVLLETKEPDKIAWEIHRLVEDQDWNMAVVQKQQERLKDFAPKKVKKELAKALKQFIESEPSNL